MARPNSPLFADHWVPWAQQHPIPITLPKTWKNQCGKHVFEAVSGTVGWKVAPKVVGPNAATVAAASGWLNPNYTTAPVGAFHFWANGPGHTAWDLNGGGEVCAMATTFSLIWELQTFLGVQSVPGYKGPFSYLGWATNYGGGVPNSLPEPVPVVVPLGPRQREVGPRGVNLRGMASPTGPATALPAGRILDIVGFVTADEPTVDGDVSSTTWFHLVDAYVWAGGMTDSGVHDLTDETPPAGITISPATGSLDTTEVDAQTQAAAVDAAMAVSHAHPRPVF